MNSLIAVVVILVVATFTPGPNNFIVMSAGARGGFRMASPLMAGIIAGGLLLLILAWAGAAVIFDAAPQLRSLMAITGSLYLGWLGGKMVWQTLQNASRPGDLTTSCNAQSHTVIGVAVFQLINPKAWILILTATAAISGPLRGLVGFTTLATSFAIISAIGLTVWALAGSAIGKFLNDQQSKHWFDRAMGGLLIASAALLLVGVI